MFIKFISDSKALTEILNIEVMMNNVINNTKHSKSILNLNHAHNAMSNLPS